MLSLAFDDEEPTDLQGNTSAFSQIGPPRNVSVNPKFDGFLVSWQAPEYGQDMLGLYVVRWFLEPEHKLHGKAETRNNYYTGKSFRSFSK